MTDDRMDPPRPRETGSRIEVRVAVGLGSNLGDRAELLESAVRRLSDHPSVKVERVSHLLENPSVGGAPGQRDYLNAALVAVTTLSVDELLELLLTIETEHGRDREREGPNGSRLLDLDLLLYADVTLNEEHLVLPHPRMLERDFVLGPLSQIAPGLRHPLTGRTIEAEAQRLAQEHLIRPEVAVALTEVLPSGDASS